MSLLCRIGIISGSGGDDVCGFKGKRDQWTRPPFLQNFLLRQRKRERTSRDIEQRKRSQRMTTKR